MDMRLRNCGMLMPPTPLLLFAATALGTGSSGRTLCMRCLPKIEYWLDKELDALNKLLRWLSTLLSEPSLLCRAWLVVGVVLRWVCCKLCCALRILRAVPTD